MGGLACGSPRCHRAIHLCPQQNSLHGNDQAGTVVCVCVGGVTGAPSPSSDATLSQMLCKSVLRCRVQVRARGEPHAHLWGWACAAGLDSSTRPSGHPDVAPGPGRVDALPECWSAVSGPSSRDPSAAPDFAPRPRVAQGTRLYGPRPPRVPSAGRWGA